MATPERLTITEAELLDALAVKSSTPAPKEYRTLAEIAESTGMDERKARKGLHRFHAKGLLSCVRVERIGIDGRRTSVPAYAILPAKKKK